jgi:hypothetical protein
MGQLGFFDADKRLAAISAKGDPLEMIDRVVPFESFRAEIEAVVLTPVEDKKSNPAFPSASRNSHSVLPSGTRSSMPSRRNRVNDMLPQKTQTHPRRINHKKMTVVPQRRSSQRLNRHCSRFPILLSIDAPHRREADADRFYWRRTAKSAIRLSLVLTACRPGSVR